MQNFKGGSVADRSPRLVARIGLSLGLAGLFLWLLASRLSDIDPAAISRAISNVHALQWSLAVAATAASFWAVGRYDAVVHRFLETGIAPNVARRAGVCAIAVSQMLGLGVVTGTVVRLRMLPGVSPVMAARLTVVVALSFLAGWSVVTSLVVLALPAAPYRGVAAVALIVAGGLIAAFLIWPNRMRGWPNLFTQTRLVGLAAVDTIAAAVALYVLLPPELGLGFVALLPAFLIAQGAGLVSGAPGGIGAFEVTLLALLPPVSQDPLLAAILAWRVIYYALPAILGGLVAAIRPGSAPAARTARPTHLSPARAETLIEAQGEHRRLPTGDWLVGRTPHVLVGMFDPLLPARTALDRLTSAARHADCWPAIYKCSADTAAIARTNGWQVLCIARDAWLDPRHFDLSLPARSGLRRKLRRAETGGVRVTIGAPLPHPAMARIAAEWARAHDGERGFSMGRYAPGYVAGQQVFLAWRGSELVGFSTFHQGQSEWALDLMRHSAAAPDGTMQALVAAALAEAARRQVPRVSLAAVPEAAFGRGYVLDRLLARFGRDGAGLLQFKAMFAPHWQPLYLAAPHPAALGLAATEIARSIADPAPLPQTEQDHAEYGFAKPRRPWQTRTQDVLATRGSDA